MLRSGEDQSEDKTLTDEIYGLHVTVQHEHLLPVIFHDLFAEVINKPTNGDSVPLAILCRDYEPVLAFVLKEHLQASAELLY